MNEDSYRSRLRRYTSVSVTFKAPYGRHDAASDANRALIREFRRFQH